MKTSSKILWFSIGILFILSFVMMAAHSDDQQSNNQDIYAFQFNLGHFNKSVVGDHNITNKSIAGNSNIAVHPIKKLAITSFGDSSISYSGNPIVSKNTFGDSSVEQIEDK